VRFGNRRNPSRQERNAYHEAGHAVAHWAMDVPFAEVSIAAAGDTLGQMDATVPALQVKRGRQAPLEARLEVEKAIVCLLAGTMAEKKLTGRHYWTGGSHDRDNALDLAMSVTGSREEAEAFLAWLLERTRNLMEDSSHWAAVETLANVLLEQEHLSGRQAHGIIERAVRA
jgi:hypothetical protein